VAINFEDGLKFIYFKWSFGWIYLCD